MASILVVDDDVDIRAVVATALECAGHSVFQSSDGDGALTTIETQPDLEVIILDVMLPHMNGWEILELIRGNPRTRNLPVLLLSAVGDAPNRTRGLKQGADDFMAKPFDPGELVARVEGVLRRTAPRLSSLASGDLSVSPLGEVLQTLAALNQCGTLRIDGPEGTGFVELGSRGWIEARMGRRSGAPAVLALLALRSGTFDLQRVSTPTAPGTPLEGLLLEAAWLEDELGKLADQCFSWRRPIALAGPRPPSVGFEDLPWDEVESAARRGARPEELLEASVSAPQAIELAFRLGLSSGWLEELQASTGNRAGEVCSVALFCHDHVWPSVRSLLIKIPSSALGEDGQRVKQRAILAPSSAIRLERGSSHVELHIHRISSLNPRDLPRTTLGPNARIVAWGLPMEIEQALAGHRARPAVVIQSRDSPQPGASPPGDIEELFELVSQP